MRKFGIFLLILAAAALLYFGWNYMAATNPDTVISGSNKISVAGKNLQGSILDSGKKQIESAKSFVENIPEQAGDVLGGLVDSAKKTLKNQLDSILETTSSPSSTLTLDYPLVTAKPSAVSGTAQISSSEPSVCFVVSKGESIEYGIEQPSGNASGTAYKVDWGDGQNASGAFNAGDRNIVVSHSYSQQGTYSVVFKLTGGSATLTASRSVCVK